MQIYSIDIKNFMIFNSLNLEFSPNINIICGENSTGKTALIKLLYSCLKGYSNACTTKGSITKEKLESMLVSKLQGVFRPDRDVIGRLVNRKQGSNRADIVVNFDNAYDLKFGFGNRQEKHIEIINNEFIDLDKMTPVYIPPKEIISSTENFGSLYDDYHISFEETYYDLTRLLERPLKKGANRAEQNAVMKSFGKIVNGSIIQKDRKFYLKVKEQGEFEMGLVSEGYRKLSTIMYLILSGSLSKNSILFWDEPETNMNPKMIRPIVEAIIELAKMGVQIFITTHDYFIQQCFNMAATYNNRTDNHLKYNFISLYHTEDGINGETVHDLSELDHNAIMEEFDDLYDREQEMLYDN